MIKLSDLNHFASALVVFFLLSSLSYDPIDSNHSESDAHIVMTITGIRSSDGIMQVGAFVNDKKFKDELSNFAYKFDKKDLIDGTLVVKFDIPADVYGFSLMDDENNNNVMDYNFFGIPKEGFGFGDYYHAGYSKPNFDKFKMEIKPGETKNITVVMRYVI